jgi:hypothetical protein
VFLKDVLNGMLVYIGSKSSNMWKLIGFFEPKFLGALSSPLSRVDQLLCLGSKDAEIHPENRSKQQRSSSNFSRAKTQNMWLSKTIDPVINQTPSI